MVGRDALPRVGVFLRVRVLEMQTQAEGRAARLRKVA